MSNQIDETPELLPLINWVLFLCGTTNLILGTYYVSIGNTSVSAAALTAGLVLLLAASLQRFKSFKGLGLQAELRIDEKLAEADEILKGLRETATISGTTLIRLGARVGRISSPFSPEEEYKLAQEICSNLKLLNIPERTISEVLQPWVDSTIFSLTLSFKKEFMESTQMVYKKYMQKHIEPLQNKTEHQEALEAHGRRIVEIQNYSLIYPIGSEHFPYGLIEYYENYPELEREIKEKAVVTIKEWIPEVDWLRENSDLKNKQIWFARINHYRFN